MISLLKWTFLLCLASSGTQKKWEDWKTEHYKEALNSPTSFLNATSLKQALSGKSLYLVLDDSRETTKWVSQKPKKYFAQAEHLGEKIRLSINDKTYTYLTNEPKKRRKKIKLPNGAIAEVVYGRRVKKMWTYIYNPDQIKKFTGFRFYPFNEKAITKATFKKTKLKKVGYKTVQGDPTQVNKVGNVSFILNGVETYLSAYNWQKPSERLSYLALIFADQTAGKETYSGGRELVIELNEPIKDGDTLSLDFNRTMNFYCAHSPFWHCPVGLQEPLKTKVLAGEMLPLKKIRER